MNPNQATVTLPHPGRGVTSATIPAYGTNGQYNGISGLGIIAEPNFPYDQHSVWNRNQLGDLGSSLGSLALGAFALYVGYVLYMNWGKGYRLH